MSNGGEGGEASLSADASVGGAGGATAPATSNGGACSTGQPQVCGGCPPGQILSSAHYPSSWANDNSIGSYSWDLHASEPVVRTMTAGGTSSYLKVTGFGYSLPANAVIGGIYVQWDRRISYSNTIVDNAVRIVKDGVVQSADRSATDFWPSPLFDAKQYGGATDLWGVPWTAADINSTGFGTALSAKYAASSGNDSPSVPLVAVYVCYQ